MKSGLQKTVVLNNPVAGDASRSNGKLIVTGLDPIPQVDLLGIDETVYTAEVRQITSIGLLNKPTITADTKYTLFVGNSAVLKDGAFTGGTKVSAKSGEELSGSAPTDRKNIYEDLVEKINANNSLFATAGLNMRVTHGAVTNGPFVKGKTVTSSSGGSGIIVKVEAGALTIADVTGTFLNANTLTSGTTTATASADGDTSDSGMFVRDAADYFAARPSPRQGKNTVTATDGFDDKLHRAVEVEAVYQAGEGTRLVKDRPVFSAVTGNLESGEMDGSADFLSGTKYNRFIISARKLVHHNAVSGLSAVATDRLTVYANKDAGDFASFRNNLITATNIQA